MFLKIKEESQKWRCQTMCVRLKCDFQNQSRLKKVSCIQNRSLNHKYPELVYRRLPYLFYSIETTQTRPFLSHSLLSEKRAIINVPDLLRKEFRYLFTLRNSCSTHHRGLIWFRISDRKFVNHTTEMILWSMILTWVEIFHYLVCFQLGLRLQKCAFHPNNENSTNNEAWMNKVHNFFVQLLID